MSKKFKRLDLGLSPEEWGILANLAIKASKLLFDPAPKKEKNEEGKDT